MKKQHLKIIIMTLIIGAYIALIGTTYAYYQVKIIENKQEKSIEVASKILEVTYIDGKADFSGSSDGYIFPGETFTKIFTVENTGDAKASFNIVLRNVTNTFIRTEDWTYHLGTITDTNQDGVINTQDQIEYLTENPIVFPTTTEQKVIYENRSIPYQTSETYVIVIHYVNSEEDQSIDMNQELSATIDITSSEITE